MEFSRFGISQTLFRGAAFCEQPALIRGSEAGIRNARLCDSPGENRAVKVVAAKRRIAARREHLENTPVKLQNRHVKRAAAEVIDDVNSFRCLIEAIGQSSGRRLIQQTENIEAGKAPRVLRRLTLRVIKVRRARNHGAHKFPFEIRLSPGAEHLQDF